jgi:FKBP-type peptidyl-prolyl cis-trans isomerase FkpA
MRHSPLLVAALALAACSSGDSTAPTTTQSAPSATAQLSTDQDKTLYAIGLAIGQNVRDFKLTESEVDLVALGLKDSVLGVN